MPPVHVFLLQALFLIGAPFAIWSIPQVRQRVPLVVVQILFGIALGPTLLARISPNLVALLLPSPSVERLSGLTWLAVLVFCFLTGLHLNVGELAQKRSGLFAIGLSSFITPLIAGIGLGLWALACFPELAGPNAGAIGFVLGIGACVATTALPVLASILRETGLIHCKLGRLAISYATLNDVLVWLLIAVLLSAVSGSYNGIGALLGIIWFSCLYVGLMAFVVRPLVGRLFARMRREGRGPSDGQMVLACTVLLGSALSTELLGLHHMIGAFAAGVIVPKEMKVSIAARFEPLTVAVLLPFYFVVTGLKVTIDLQSADMLVFFSVATLTAMGSKIVGTAVPARLSGHAWPDALSLGVLMQSKGLMEALVLTTLLDAGLISSVAFSAMIMMALVTTALTMPLTKAISCKADRITKSPIRSAVAGRPAGRIESSNPIA